MSTKPEHLQLIGVKHNDRRVPELIEEELELPIDEVFHETPVSESSTLRYAWWTFWRNPLAGVIALFRVISAIIGGVRFTLEMVVKGKANQLTLNKDGLVQGRRAADRIEEKHGIGWKPIGVNRIERVQLLPYGLSLLSWFSVAVLLLSIYTMPISPIVGFLLFFTSLGTVLTVSKTLGDARRPARDKRMFENILDACDQDDRVAVIVGENHIKGLSCHASISGINHETAWVSSTADIEGMTAIGGE